MKIVYNKRNIKFFISSMVVSLLYCVFISYLPVISGKSDLLNINIPFLIFFGIWMFIEIFIFILFYGKKLEIQYEFEISKLKISFLLKKIINGKRFFLLLTLLTIFLIKPQEALYINNWNHISIFLVGRAVIFLFFLLLLGYEIVNFIFTDEKKIQDSFLFKIGFGIIVALFIHGLLTTVFIRININSNLIIVPIIEIVLAIFFSEKNWQKKKKNSDLTISLSPYYILTWTLIIISITLIGLGSSFFLKYLLPGDNWTILQSIRTFFTENPDFLIFKFEYPNFWPTLLYGLSKTMGIPLLNAGALLVILNFSSFITIYIFGGVFFPKMDKKRRFEILFLFFFISSNYWIFIIFGNQEIASISATPYYAILFQFNYLNLFISGVLWTIFFIIQATNSCDDENKKHHIIFIIFAAVSTFFAFIIHFIEILICIPIVFILIQKIKNHRKKWALFSIYCFILLFLFLILNLISNGTYLTLLFYMVNRFNRESFNINYSIPYTGPIVIIFYILCFIFCAFFYYLGIFFEKYSKKQIIISPNNPKIMKIDKIKEKVKKYNVKKYLLLLTAILYIYSQLWWIIEILIKQDINGHIKESSLSLPWQGITISIFAIGFLSIYGFYYLKISKLKLFSFSILYIIILGCFWWSGRIWHYLILFVVPLVVFSIPHITNTLKKSFKIPFKKKDIEILILIAVMMISFPSNLIAVYHFHNYDSNFIISNDMADLLNYMDKNIDNEDNILISPWNMTLEYNAVKNLAPGNLVIKEEINYKTISMNISVFLKDRNVDYCFLKKNSEGGWVNPLDDVIIQYSDYDFVFSSLHNQYFILKFKPDDGFKGKYWVVGEEPNDCMVSDLYSWNDTVISGWEGRDMVVELFSENGTASCRYNFNSPQNIGTVTFWTFFDESRFHSPQYHIGNGSTYLYVQNSSIYWYNGSYSFLINDSQPFHEKWFFVNVTWELDEILISLNNNNPISFSYQTIPEFFKIGVYYNQQTVYFDSLYFSWNDES